MPGAGDSPLMPLSTLRHPRRREAPQGVVPSAPRGRRPGRRIPSVGRRPVSRCEESQMKKSTVPVTRETEDPRRTALAGWPGFGSLREEIDRIFDSFAEPRGWFGRGLTEPMSGPAMIVPPVDFVEKNGGYELAAELPGLDPADVEVKV